MTTAIQVIGAIVLAGLIILILMWSIGLWMEDHCKELEPVDTCPARSAISAASKAVGSVASERRELHDALRHAIDAYDSSTARLMAAGKTPLPTAEFEIDKARALLVRVQP